MENNYTVYIHIFPNNKVYIGITRRKPIYRWNNGKAYYHNIFMRRAIKKYGWENVKHEILYEHLTKEEAEQKEIELIKFYNSTNDNFGYNIEKGGNHIGKISDKTKAKLSKAHLGKVVTKKTREKISKTLKGTRHGFSITGAKPVNMYDLNGTFIESYCSLKECERKTGIAMQHISLCCHNKRAKTHGYIFKFKK